eukprot:3468730-Rhodomonas_salina.2
MSGSHPPLPSSPGVARSLSCGTGPSATPPVDRSSQNSSRPCAPGTLHASPIIATSSPAMLDPAAERAAGRRLIDGPESRAASSLLALSGVGNSKKNSGSMVVHKDLSKEAWSLITCRESRPACIHPPDSRLSTSAYTTPNVARSASLSAPSTARQSTMEG